MMCGRDLSQKHTVTGQENVAIVAIKPVVQGDQTQQRARPLDSGTICVSLEANQPSAVAVVGNRWERAGVVPAMPHWKPSSAREILLMSFAFVL